MKRQSGKIRCKTPNTLRIWKIKWHYAFLNPKDNLWKCPKESLEDMAKNQKRSSISKHAQKNMFSPSCQDKCKPEVFSFFLISHYGFLNVFQNNLKNRQAALINRNASDSCSAVGWKQQNAKTCVLKWAEHITGCVIPHKILNHYAKATKVGDNDIYFAYLVYCCYWEQ